MIDILFHPLYSPVFVFVLRVLNNVIGTFRVIAMTDNRRLWGFGLASLESLLFAYTAGIVLTNLSHVPNLAAYVLGFSVGGYVSMSLERYFLNLYNIVDITADEAKAHEIATKLRDENFGVTEIHGEGSRGHVMQLRCVAHHREVKNIINIAREVKPNAFITVEESRYIENGWLRSKMRQHER